MAKILELIARGADDRRAVLQLGYNLGRLSELTGLGREPFWDRWKEAVACWDREELDALARQLQRDSAAWTEGSAAGMAVSNRSQDGLETTAR